MVISIVLVAGFIATAAEGDIPGVGDLSKKAKNITDVTKGYVEKFAEKRNVKLEDINNVTEVDFNDLPKEVNIENVNDANLAIYQVDYQEGSEERQLFVITYSTDELKAQGDLIIAHDKRQFISFGISDETAGSGFLESATGVEGSLNTGYVMLRPGSITGISTNLRIVNSSSSNEMSVIVYKNGEAIVFGNDFDASGSGSQKDHDIQSNGVVTFQPGDIISAYVDAPSDASWDNVITLIEITTK